MPEEAYCIVYDQNDEVIKTLRDSILLLFIRYMTKGTVKLDDY